MEIQVRDLRVGNYLESPYKHVDETDLCVVISIDEETFTCLDEHEILREADKVRPIPLTEEWWDKFGYECIQEFIIDMIEKSIHPLDESVGIWVATISPLPIHRIQNLFKELTNEELTLKNK